VIVMGLHIANWEVVGPALINLGLRFSAVYRVPRNPALHRMAVAIRNRYGGRLLPQGPEGAREALQVLKTNEELLLIYADDLVDMKVQAPRFGRDFEPRGNLVKIVHLAMLFRAVVIPAYVIRVRGAIFQVHFGEGIYLDGDAMDGAARWRNYAMLDRQIEDIVRQYLSSWYLLPLLDLKDRS
jgi:KDO2-lipid IV(A) lauroyltransferase